MSQAVHATSSKLEGPYERVELAIPTQTHNTYYAFSPLDKIHLIYSIFGGNNPESCNPYKKCTNGSTPGHGSGVHPDSWQPAPTCPLVHGTYLHYSSSLNGPWQNAGQLRFDTTGCSNCGFSNPGERPFLSSIPRSRANTFFSLAVHLYPRAFPAVHIPRYHHRRRCRHRRISTSPVHLSQRHRHHARPG